MASPSGSEPWAWTATEHAAPGRGWHPAADLDAVTVGGRLPGGGGGVGVGCGVGVGVGIGVGTGVGVGCGRGDGPGGGSLGPGEGWGCGPRVGTDRGPRASVAVLDVAPPWTSVAVTSTRSDTPLDGATYAPTQLFGDDPSMSTRPACGWYRQVTMSPSGSDTSTRISCEVPCPTTS